MYNIEDSSRFKRQNNINPKTGDWFHIDYAWLRTQMEKDISKSLNNIPSGIYFMKTLLIPFVIIFAILFSTLPNRIFFMYLGWISLVSLILTLPFYIRIKRAMQRNIFLNSPDLTSKKYLLLRQKTMDIREDLDRENEKTEKDMVKIAKLNRHLREVRALRSSIQSRMRNLYGDSKMENSKEDTPQEELTLQG